MIQPKDLRKLAKTAAKLGIKTLKTPEIEFTLSDRALELAMKRSFTVPKSATLADVGGKDMPSDDEMLFHSTPIVLRERTPASAAMADIPLGRGAKVAPVSASAPPKQKKEPRGKA